MLLTILALPEYLRSTSPVLIAVYAALGIISVAWLVVAVRKERWVGALGALGPLAVAALLAGLVRPLHTPLPEPTPGPAAAQPPVTAPAVPEAVQKSFVPKAADSTARALPIPAGPPPEVVLTGTWSAEDRIVVRNALVAALARVPGARGNTVVLDGTGRTLASTRNHVPRYGIAATWTLRAGSGDAVLHGDALPDVTGWGPTPDDARRDAALRAAQAVSAALRDATSSDTP